MKPPPHHLVRSALFNCTDTGRFVAFALFALGALGCAGSNNVGENLDASSDATLRDSAMLGPHDECGNGMDDDGDGTIDEGCFCGAGETQSCFSGTYPNRRVGRCADGVQACEAAEFGQWGSCEGDTLPIEEACDGAVDDDCDGAIDEGCPCTTGETRDCGVEFLIAPCTGGVQTCLEGDWSSCAGAIGPSAEICEDDVDNDCDGDTNEGCGCVPTPEVCGDGIDNDCDGIVDEPACRTEMDAGVDADVDAGVDAATDSGPPGLTSCTNDRELQWDRLSRPSTDPVLAGGNRSHAVWTGSESVFAFAASSGERSAPVSIHLSRYDGNGTHLATVASPITLAGLFSRLRGLVWTGTDLVVAYDAGGATAVQRLGLDGSLVGEAVAVPGIQAFLGWNGTELAVAYRASGAGGGLFFRAYDASLGAVGPVVEVRGTGTGSYSLDFGGHGLVWTGSRWAFAWTDNDTGRVEVASLTSTSLEGTQVATRPGGATDSHTTPNLIGGDDGAIWCWEHVFGMWDFEFWCERLDGNVIPSGSPVNLTGRLSTMGGFVGGSRWGDGYVLIFVSTTPGQSDSYVWRDGMDPMTLDRPSDMDGSMWGFSYWEAGFGLIESGPGALLLQGRGDAIVGDPDRSGNPTSRVRLTCL